MHVLSVKLTPSILEFADLGWIQGAILAGGSIKTPLMMVGIVCSTRKCPRGKVAAEFANTGPVHQASSSAWRVGAAAESRARSIVSTGIVRRPIARPRIGDARVYRDPVRLPSFAAIIGERLLEAA
jgi:hypothetical protein